MSVLLYVFDAWDDTAQESTSEVFLTKAGAEEYQTAYLKRKRRHNVFHGIVRRRLRP